MFSLLFHCFSLFSLFWPWLIELRPRLQGSGSRVPETTKTTKTTKKIKNYGIYVFVVISLFFVIFVVSVVSIACARQPVVSSVCPWLAGCNVGLVVGLPIGF